MLAQAKAQHRLGRFRMPQVSIARYWPRIQRRSKLSFCWAHACHALGLVSEAIARLSEALGQRPDLAEVHHHLGVVLAENRQPDEAERSIRRALELKPEMVDAHTIWASC